MCLLREENIIFGLDICLHSFRSLFLDILDGMKLEHRSELLLFFCLVDNQDRENKKEGKTVTNKERILNIYKCMYCVCLELLFSFLSKDC